MAVPASAETDTFRLRGGSFGNIKDPISNAAAVTLHDTNELSIVPRALYIGGAGNLKVTMLGGTAVTFNGLVAGTVLPIRCHILWATGSTASATLNIVALW